MSPEQCAGSEVGAASDQFSFCVALFHALYGQHPFDTSSLDALFASVQAGELREPPRRPGVPGWLLPILRRGLARDPHERYPSMDALLAALDRDPARNRRRWLLAALVVALAALPVYTLTRSEPATTDACQGGRARMAAVWNPERRATLEQAFTATESLYAGEAWPRVSAGLDRFADDWARMHRDACVAHRDGVESGSVLDLRMACLNRREIALAHAVSTLAETDRQSLPSTVQVVQKLPPVAYCADIEALSAEIPPPEDPALAHV